MNQTGTFNGVDVVGGEDRVAVRARHVAFGFGLVTREVREDRVVAAASSSEPLSSRTTS